MPERPKPAAQQASAQVREAPREKTRQLEVTVPRGTQVPELLRIKDTLIRDIIPDLTGCRACLSGVIVRFQETPDLIRDIQISALKPG